VEIVPCWNEKFDPRQESGIFPNLFRIQAENCEPAGDVQRAIEAQVAGSHEFFRPSLPGNITARLISRLWNQLKSNPFIVLVMIRHTGAAACGTSACNQRAKVCKKRKVGLPASIYEHSSRILTVQC